MNKKKLFNAAKNIKLLAMDIDGVLTGGEIIIFDDGQEIKFWNVKDRLAFHFSKKYLPELKFAWITGRSSKQVAERAGEIGIDALYQNVMNKGSLVNELCGRFEITSREIAYIGDDLIDISLLNKVGLSACPKDAVPEVRKIAHFVSDFQGGRGVLRQVVEIILKSRGIWDKIVKRCSL